MISIFVYMRILVPVPRDDYVTWDDFNFWARNKVNMTAIRNVALSISHSYNTIFNNLLASWCNNLVENKSKKFVGLGNCLEIKKTWPQEKLRRINQRRRFLMYSKIIIKNGIILILKSVLKERCTWKQSSSFKVKSKKDQTKGTQKTYLSAIFFDVCDAWYKDLRHTSIITAQIQIMY